MHPRARPHTGVRLPQSSWMVFCLLSSPAIARARTPKSVGESTASASWLAAEAPRCGEVMARRIWRAGSEPGPWQGPARPARYQCADKARGSDDLRAMTRVATLRR